MKVKDYLINEVKADLSDPSVKKGAKLAHQLIQIIETNPDNIEVQTKAASAILSAIKSLLSTLSYDSIKSFHGAFNHILGNNISKKLSKDADAIIIDAENKASKTGGSTEELPKGTGEKKPEETGGEKKPEETGGEKKPEETGGEKKPEETGGEKKPEETIGSVIKTADGREINITQVSKQATDLILSNDVMEDRNKNVYMRFFKDVDDLTNLPRDESIKRAEEIVLEYGLETNKNGELYVNNARLSKDDHDNTRKGIKKYSKYYVNLFNHYDVDLSYQETEKNPASILGATAKPELDRDTIRTSQSDEKVAKLFDKPPFDTFETKYKSVYAPVDSDGLLLDNEKGINSKAYLEHSINSNTALTKSTEAARRLADAGKIDPKVVTTFENLTNDLQKVLKDYDIPSEMASKAIGDLYSNAAVSLYNLDENIANGVMKQFAEMALYDTEIANGEECYLPANGSFPSGDKLKISSEGKGSNKVERITAISVKYGLAGGKFGYYGFPGETAQYQRYHPDEKKRKMLSSSPGKTGHLLGIGDDFIDDDSKYEELMKNSGFGSSIKDIKAFREFIKKHKQDTQEIIASKNGNLSKSRKLIDSLDVKAVEDMMKYIDKDELIKILGSDNAKLAMTKGPACLMCMIGFSNLLITSNGLDVIEHNHQHFEDGAYHTSTDDYKTGTNKIKHWKYIWRPSGVRTQGGAASYNSKRKDLDIDKSYKEPDMIIKNGDDDDNDIILKPDGTEKIVKKKPEKTNKPEENKNDSKIYDILQKRLGILLEKYL